MPVLVTHADTPIGVRLVTALGRDGVDLRAFADGSGDVAALRAQGAIVAVGDHDDEGHLDAAMTHAHTVVVPAVSWLSDAMAVTASLPVVVRAADLAGVQRLVLVSLLGADPQARNELLAALGRVEQAAAGSELQSLVVRTDGVIGASTADVVTALRVCPDTTMAPAPADALVEGLVALDRARSTQIGGHAVFTALGAVRSVTDLRDDDDLVGRRWLPPDRRNKLAEHLCTRGTPAIEGADLWGFVARQGQGTGL